jgi:hypothetical protein
MMLEREHQFGYGTVDNPNHLLLPVIGCDGNSFPEFSRNIPKLTANSFVTQAPAFESLPKYFDFEGLVHEWVQMEVAESVNHAPAWNPEWLMNRIVPFPAAPRPKFGIPAL